MYCRISDAVCSHSSYLIVLHNCSRSPQVKPKLFVGFHSAYNLLLPIFGLFASGLVKPLKLVVISGRHALRHVHLSLCRVLPAELSRPGLTETAGCCAPWSLH